MALGVDMPARSAYVAGKRAWRSAPVVDASRDLVGVVTLEQLRHAAGELDEVDATGDVALRIREHLAVLGREHRDQRIALLIEQLDKSVQYASTTDG